MRKVDPVKHAEKRTAILDAARNCFVRDGFRGASISDICAEARISPGHLYHYFAGKEAIVGAMIETGMSYAATLFAKMAEQSNAVTALLAELERGKSRHMPSHHVLLLDILGEAGRNPTIAGILRAQTQALRTLIADFLRDGQAKGQIDPALDPDLAATMLIAISDGTKSAMIRDATLDMDRYIDQLKILIGRFLTR